MGMPYIRTVALQIIDDLLCREWDPAAQLDLTVHAQRTADANSALGAIACSR